MEHNNREKYFVTAFLHLILHGVPHRFSFSLFSNRSRSSGVQHKGEKVSINQCFSSGEVLGTGLLTRNKKHETIFLFSTEKD